MLNFADLGQFVRLFCLDRVFQVSTHGCFADLLGDLPFVKIFLRFVSALPLSLVSAIRVASSVVSVYHDVLISIELDL